MSIGAGIIIFLIGCLVGYMICMTSWIKQLSDDTTKVDIEIAKIKAEMRREDGNDKLSTNGVNNDTRNSYNCTNNEVNVVR